MQEMIFIYAGYFFSIKASGILVYELLKIIKHNFSKDPDSDDNVRFLLVSPKINLLKDSVYPFTDDFCLYGPSSATLGFLLLIFWS